ncbi:MAG: cell division protein FtsZ [Methanomassiliicoccaceae archaeon]|nr:cell division protein FtsZ [Methanomassiliicoccaceae archaeon]MCL2146138.1 cell division protein FtsZ [Methanomassiliicoccaceae archaeon]
MEANTKETERSITIEPRIAVVGIGGAGCNVVSGFYKALAPVDTIAINTDRKALDETAADKKVYICKAVTKGEGTKGDARLGNKCAKIHEEEIEKAVIGHDAVFIIAGLGGGTGTGAASVVAEICSRNNMMTFTIGINPFFFETEKVSIAREGIRTIRATCPNTFTIENDKVLDLMPNATMNEAMRTVNKSIMGFVGETSATLASKIKDEITTIQKTVYSKKMDVGNTRELPLFSGV